MGEFPVACLAEEIETEGDGRIRALFTVAGNPVLSTPNGARLAAALESLDFMVSLDIYVNETSRHADVILPGLSPLEESHFDFAFNQLACRNTARYSPPVLEAPDDRPAEWQTLLRLAAIVTGQGAAAELEGLDNMVVLSQIQRAVGDEHSLVYGRDLGEILAALEPRRGPERLVDFGLRSGPYGDGFGARREGLSLDVLERHPHGVDLGPLQPRLPEVLRTLTGKIELAPPTVLEDMRRLRGQVASESDDGLLLIGRRHLRSNNSWMHNLPLLAGGRPRCTLLIHPDDAAARGLAEGSVARVRSRAGSVDVPIEVTAEIMRGVVSLPHGWGHDLEGTSLQVASRQPGINSNLLTDEHDIDPVSGNAVLNGIPVSVESR
jgi:anaerobic selenocysteine-containing dehydrogenase